MRSWLFALAAAAPPAILYAGTMAPGLLARGDVPKFQFLGAVLGTAHAPGYPLFVQLSWLAAQVPWGTVAWRVNVMNAGFGVAAAVAAAWVARRAGASRPAALVAAWGLASGPVFWEQATAAEVYTLAALLQALAFGLVLRWSATRREGHLLQAIACSALALGHHPTFAMAAPALAAFVLVTDWRVVTRWRVMAVGAALLAVGLAQYAFILLRTAQGALYLEARASSLADLVEVLRGTQYESSLFAFSAGEMITSRAPQVWQWIQAEVGWAGLLLAVVGWISLLRLAWRQVVLFGLASVLVFSFSASFDVGDIHVFVVPVMLCFWIVAAIGLDRLTGLLHGPTRSAVAVGVSAALLAAAVSRSYASRDLHLETEDAEYVEALLSGITTPAAVLFDSYDPLSHALRYALYAERSGHRLRIGYAAESEDPLVDYTGGRAIYANETARAILTSRGLWLAPMEFDRRLTSIRRSLPPDTLWLVALPAGSVGSLSDDDVRFFRALGLDRLPAREAIVAFSRGGDTVEESAGAAPSASLTAAWGAVTSGVSAEEAWARTGDLHLRMPAAGLVAAFGRAGTLRFWTGLNRTTGVRPVFDSARRPLFRVVGSAACAVTTRGQAAVLGGDSADRLGTRLSAWVRRRPSVPGRRVPAGFTAYLGSETAALRASGQALDAEVPLTATSEIFDRQRPADDAALGAAAARDRVEVPAGRFVTRAHFSWTGKDDAPAGVAASVVLSHRPDAVVALTDAHEPMQVCAPPVAGVSVFGDPSERRWEAVRHESEAVGSGWHAVDDSGRERLRWMREAKAGVRFTLATTQSIVVRLQAAPLRVRAGDAVDIIVNGQAVGAKPVQDGARTYEWSVPEALWRPGFNEVVVSGPAPESPLAAGLGPDSRLLGLGVTELALVRDRR